MKKRLFLCLCLLMTLSACQPANQNQQTHLSQLQNDFASGVNVVLDYVSDTRRTIVVCDVDNQQGVFIDLWLVQENSTLGQRTMSARRFYTGNSKVTQKVFRLPVGRPGITESIHVEVLDKEGQLVFSTEPITNSHKEEVQ